MSSTAGVPGGPPISGWTKFKIKFAEAPLVPLGSLLTAGILLGGFRAFQQGKDKHTQQRYMRARVAAQGFTLACLFYFSFYGGTEKPSLEHKIVQHHNSLGAKGNPLIQDNKDKEDVK